MGRDGEGRGRDGVGGCGRGKGRFSLASVGFLAGGDKRKRSRGAPVPGSRMSLPLCVRYIFEVLYAFCIHIYSYYQVQKFCLCCYSVTSCSHLHYFKNLSEKNKTIKSQILGKLQAISEWYQQKKVNFKPGPGTAHLISFFGKYSENI